MKNIQKVILPQKVILLSYILLVKKYLSYITFHLKSNKYYVT